MLQTLKEHALTLGAFALASTSLVVMTHAMTENRIERAQKAQRLQQLQVVLPSTSFNTATQQNCPLSLALNAINKNAVLTRIEQDGQLQGFAIEATTQAGYNGDIRLLLGFTPQGDIEQVRVLEHKETPGLGDKIDTRISDWITIFHGQSPNSEKDFTWYVTKDGGKFDGFTGATITPRAVVNAVREIAWYAKQHLAKLTQGAVCDGQSNPN